MKTRKILGTVIAALILLGSAGFFLVRTWSNTPHGRLDWRVALYLHLTDANRSGVGNPTVTVAESRKTLDEKASAASGTPAKMESVRDMKASAGGLTVPVRVYRPVPGGPLPVIVFYHGGGWAQGSLDSHDSLCRILAKKTGALVMAVDYRLAPEHTYPAAVNDAYAALVWASENGKALNADTSRIAVAGDSAGGNLAAAVCLMARDRKGPAIRFQALIYPAVESAYLRTASYKMFAKGYMLTRKDVDKFIEMYLPDRKDRLDPYASPILALSHRDLPPALVVTAEFDVLRDEGEAYAAALNSSGVAARAVRYPGMIHGFVSADRLVPHAGQATDEIASAIRKAFGTK